MSQFDPILAFCVTIFKFNFILK